MDEQKVNQILEDEDTDIDDLMKIIELDEKWATKYEVKARELILGLDIGLEELRNSFIYCGQAKQFGAVNTMYDKLLTMDYTNFELRVVITYIPILRERASKDLLEHSPENYDLTHIIRYHSPMTRKVWKILKEKGPTKEDLLYIEKAACKPGWIVPSKKPIPGHIISEVKQMLEKMEE